MDLLNISKFSHIDLRSENEFEKGTIPNSINLPILKNDEFQAVGKEYKIHGQEAAMKLGLELTSGSTKEDRIKGWETHINSNIGCSIFVLEEGSDLN